MLHHLLQAVFEKATGTPYYTTRCASREFGPAPAKVHAAYLSKLDDEAAHREWQAIKRIRPRPVAAFVDGVVVDEPDAQVLAEIEAYIRRSRIGATTR